MKLQNPPRFIPLPVRIETIFGGFLNQFGWFFFGFGMIFFWVFAANALLDMSHFSGTLNSTMAVIEEVSETGAEINERDVWAHYYSYKVKGKAYEGVSYATNIALPEGTQIKVEYSISNPYYSRVKRRSFRSSLFPAWVGLIVVIFPLAGLIMLYFSLRKSRKDLRLLVHGKLSFGTLISKKPTSTSINDQTVYKMIFSYKVNGHTYQTEAKTHMTEKLEDESEERVLYLPKLPKEAILVDNIPGGIIINQHGGIKSSHPLGSLKSLVIPGLSIVGHGFWFLIKLQG